MMSARRTRFRGGLLVGSGSALRDLHEKRPCSTLVTPHAWQGKRRREDRCLGKRRRQDRCTPTGRRLRSRQVADMETSLVVVIAPGRVEAHALAQTVERELRLCGHQPRYVAVQAKDEVRVAFETEAEAGKVLTWLYGDGQACEHRFRAMWA